MQEKTKALGHSEKRLHYFRQSALTNGTTEHTAPHEVLARERYYNGNGVTAWDDTKSASAPTETRRKAIQKQGRRRQPSIKALNEEIEKYSEGVLKGTATERNVCLRLLQLAYEMKDEMMSTPGSTTAKDQDSASTHREDGGASSQKNHLRETVSQAARSATDLLATEHRSTHHGDKFRSRGCSKLDVTGHSPNSMSNRFMRVRSSQSDNNFHSKRTRHRENSVHKRRTLSEPAFRKKLLIHRQSVAGGFGIAVQKSLALSGGKRSSSTNGTVRAQSVYSRARTTSTVQEQDSSVRKSLRSRSHSSGPRSSERLLQPRKTATHSRHSGISLQNEATKNRKSSIESDRIGKDASLRLCSSVRHTTSNNMQGLPNGSETASQSETARVTNGSTVEDVAKEKLTITIPADTSMATSLRGYSQWPGKSRNIALVNLDLTTPSR